MIQQLINDERFTNIQRAQAGLTKLFKQAKASFTFYRVLKNDQALGVLVPENIWESLMEDLEALSSSNYRKRIAQARAEGKTISANEVKRQLGIK